MLGSLEGQAPRAPPPRALSCKSLLLDTIKELFEGSEALFRGLAVHDRWEWTPRPVVRLSFGTGNFAEPGWLAEDADAQRTSSSRCSPG